ncbi:MAG TPA: phenylalanine--tRNA ligase subunit beta [Dehalococcoidia bacterium]|nr:phenylalanine--tRNA ligase subunit beta [Dehalococcoidia bacterium]
MRVSLKWLSEYVDLRLPADELARLLTQAGLAVDAIVCTGGDWGPEIRVGEVAAVDSHPNADRLRLATVDVTPDERHRVVCGAPNLAVGQRIAFATVGARVRDGHSGKPSVLKPAVIRGVESAGMVLSERELGLSDEHEGILVLPPHTPLGAPLADVLGDTIFELSVTPNRPDWLSVLGIAREVAALTGATVREPSLDYPAAAPVKGKVAVRIAAPDLCVRYVATVVTGIKLGPSPGWMQERLIALGQRPINNVVDITNYVMLELGQPLHAFDYDRIAGHQIIVRRGEEGERFTTLDNEDRTLTRDMLVIADERRPVALAGVIGGLESEVTARTANVLLEAATFLAASVRRTGAALRLRSEASLRFEKGLPPELALIASQRATKLLVELCGGTACAGSVDAYPAKAREQRVEITRERLARVLGIDPPVAKVRAVLTALGFSARWVPPDRYVVRVPYWRPDVRIADDVAEEVARIIGYDQIPAKLLEGAIPPLVEQPLRELRERARDVLAAAGMTEVITYSLTTLEAIERVVPREHLAIYPPYRMVNPISADHEYLRPTLRASILQTLAANLRYQKGEVAIFEAARTYHHPDQRLAQSGRPFGEEALPDEQEHLVAAVTGRRFDRWGRPSTDAVDFFDACAYLDDLLHGLGVVALRVVATEHGFVPGRTAEIQVAGERIGVIGQVHPDVAAAFGVEQDAFVFDLTLDALAPHIGGVRKARPVSKFPAVEQDIALVVDADMPAAEVRAIIESTALVREARIFDVYTGDQVPPGKKSLAFALVYQSDDHTLTDDEVARAQRRLLERLRRDLAAELRGP